MVTLNKLFNPEVVAIVGASQDPTRIGGRPITYSLQAGYSGQIIPMNSKYQEVQGLKCVKSWDEIEEPIDVAVLAIPAASIPAVMRSANGRVGYYVIYAGGFGETGIEGRKVEEEILSIALEQNARVIGPNCVGLTNGSIGLNLTFTTGFEGLPVTDSGRVGIVSQSGAFGVYIYGIALRERLGAVKFISTGNEIDISVMECLQSMVEDDGIDTVIAYLESEPDGVEFRRMLRVLDERNKYLIVVRPGNTAGGKLAAKSHTGSIVTSNRMLDGAMMGHNAVRVKSIDDVIDLTRALARGAMIRGNKVGVITLSGGAGILMADAAEEYSLELPEMPEEYQRHVKGRVPFAATRNPVDVTAQFINDKALVRMATEGMESEGCVDVIAMFLSHVISVESVGPALIESISNISRGIPLYISGYGTDEVIELLSAQGVPLYRDPDRLMWALGTLGTISRRRRLYELSNTKKDAALASRAMENIALVSSTTDLSSEAAIKKYLMEQGFEVPRSTVIDSNLSEEEVAEEVARCVTNREGTWAIKVSDAEIHHKTELGLIKLDVKATEVLEVVGQLKRTSMGMGYKSSSIVVEEMINETGIEFIVSVRREPKWGEFIIIGIGGGMVELFKEVVVVRLPCSPEVIEDQIKTEMSWLNDPKLRSRLALFGARLVEKLLPKFPQGSYEVELNPVRIVGEREWILDATSYVEARPVMFE